MDDLVNVERIKASLSELRYVVQYNAAIKAAVAEARRVGHTGVHLHNNVEEWERLTKALDVTIEQAARAGMK
jgi:hypothetical protein